MYWCKRYILVLTGLIILFCTLSCKKDSRAGTDTKAFFDLKGYFTADSLRLTKLDPLINKTVTHNDETQTKKMRISNWGNEFRLFTESDINKPSWQASYNIQATNDFLIYKAKYPNLKTRDIIIKRAGDKIKWILIFNHTKNPLYESEEKLSYYPDSLYLIQKLQKVRLLGTEKYSIKGVF
jgi:hypothetical protein